MNLLMVANMFLTFAIVMNLTFYAEFRIIGSILCYAYLMIIAIQAYLLVKIDYLFTRKRSKEKHGYISVMLSGVWYSLDILYFM